ncbi:hypothetical protein EDD16DRAFT_1520066 [Pisolithus croceorrhizus]|nr:hypothetical protein EDD16DRAFT_1520066 [Pisolithus croceorrhizus]KAI6125208.1 hypothetical protein EV401DRAFT_1131888 [Pisolithus croceorrhizus]KAI6161490.1 hypothetical protein EDD17DRAFT_691143 [Pisolithus thermaeus]
MSTLVAIFQQLYPSIMPTAFVPPVFHGSYPETNAVLGHEYYNTSLESPDVGFFAPTQFIPPMVSVQPTGVNIPAGHSTLAQGYSGQFGSDASAIATSGTSMGILSSADLASSQTHSFPAPLAGSASSVPPQAKSQSSGDLKPCKWRNNRGGICGELVGWHCQDHLAHAHGIFRIPSSRSIECGACGEQQKRKYILRHFREVHLEFRRGT